MLAEGSLPLVLPADPALNRLLLGASAGRTGSVAECRDGCVIELFQARAIPRLVVRRYRGHEREERDRADRCGRTPLSPSGDEMAVYGVGMARTLGGRE
jgi:hypothetical protein